MNFKLGKLVPQYDPRSLYLRMYVELNQLPTLQSSTNWRSKVTVPWGVMLNDSLGDCGCAGAGHAIMNISANSGTIVVPTDQDVLQMYEDPSVGGYNPNASLVNGNNPTDNGIMLVNGLNYLRQKGMAGQKLDAYADILSNDITMMKYSIQLFGGLYHGVTLPKSAMDNFDAGIYTWSDITDTNILGGHCIFGVDFDAGGIYFVTWGQIVYATNAWVEKFTDESHAPLMFDWITNQGLSPSGFNQQRLEADLKLITN